ATATLGRGASAGAAAAGAAFASIMFGALASFTAYVGCGLKSIMPGSADANVTVGAAGSAAVSAHSAGKRKPTLSEGAISATAATTVVEVWGVRPARTLKPAANPPTPAPPRMARHAITLVLIPLDRPRMFPQPVFPNAASSSLQTERNYGYPGTFLRRVSRC